MRHVGFVTVMVIISLVLGACASKPEIPFDRAAAADVKTIGVLTPCFPDDASVFLASTPGQSFGLIGALIDAGLEAKRDATFNAILAQSGYSVRDAFLENLTAGLKERGFEVKTIPVPRGKNDFMSSYPPAGTVQVDAYLDLVTVTYGYVAAGIRDKTPYRPNFVLRAKLVRAKDASVLMQNAIIYNPIVIGEQRSGFVSIPPDTEYQFVDFDNLTANPENAVAGVKVAVQKSARAVGTLLK